MTNICLLTIKICKKLTEKENRKNEQSIFQMFSNPSKSVPTTSLDLTVRFLVPAKVIFEALTTENMAQVKVVAKDYT